MKIVVDFNDLTQLIVADLTSKGISVNENDIIFTDDGVEIILDTVAKAKQVKPVKKAKPKQETKPKVETETVSDETETESDDAEEEFFDTQTEEVETQTEEVDFFDTQTEEAETQTEVETEEYDDDDSLFE